MIVKFNRYFFNSRLEFEDWKRICSLDKVKYIGASSSCEGFDWYTVNGMSCYVPIEEQLIFNV